MALPLNTAAHEELNNAIGVFFGSGKYSAVTMKLFADKDATNNVGPENARVIESVNLTQQYTDATGVLHNATITVLFTDGTSVVSTDNENEYFYTLAGVEFQHKRWN